MEEHIPSRNLRVIFISGVVGGDRQIDTSRIRVIQGQERRAELDGGLRTSCQGWLGLQSKGSEWDLLLVWGNRAELNLLRRRTWMSVENSQQAITSSPEKESIPSGLSPARSFSSLNHGHQAFSKACIPDKAAHVLTIHLFQDAKCTIVDSASGTNTKSTAQPPPALVASSCPLLLPTPSLPLLWGPG